LSGDEIEALEVLKKIGNERTDSKIIRYVILRFKEVSDELKREQIKNRQLKNELTALKEKVKVFNTALGDLKKIK
jgi:hypothetical protein